MAESYTVPYFTPDDNPYANMFKCDKTLLIPPTGATPSNVSNNNYYEAYSIDLGKPYKFCLVLNARVTENTITGQNPDQYVSGKTTQVASMTLPGFPPRELLGGDSHNVTSYMSYSLTGSVFTIRQYYGTLVYVQNGNQVSWKGVYSFFGYPSLWAFFE